MADISGNLSPNNADFLPQFKAIGQGLRKRFFRKPNVAEAIEQYEDLGQELLRENQTDFAALCYLEASKCQEPLKNPIQQANLLLKSGRFYLSAQNDRQYFQDDSSSLFFRDDSLHSSLSGHLENAVNCLSQAAKIYKREKLLALSVLVTLEMGEALFKAGCYGDALKQYRAALDTVRQNFTYIDVLLVTDQIIRCKLTIQDYDSALKIISDTLVGVNNSGEEEISRELRSLFRNRLEISRVLLLLLLGTNTVDLLGFIWPGESSGAEVGLKSLGGDKGLSEEDKFVEGQLKSLVIGVEHGSEEEIEQVRWNLAGILNQCQHNLFEVLVKILA